MAKWLNEREREIEWAKGFVAKVAESNGFELEMRNPDAPQYQLAKITGPGFCMIVYPHKTSCGNHHMRIRDQGSQDKEAYRKAVEAYFTYSGNNCSFQPKHARSVISREAFMEAARMNRN
jgi:hypothetical protein